MIIFLLPLIILFFVWLRFHKNAVYYYQQFRVKNVIVAGKKRTGKDLLFMLMIYMYSRRGLKHYSNIYYNEDTIIKDIGELTVAPNTYEDFIDGKVVPVQKTNEEGIDYFCSDGGNALPSQYYGYLNKKYPSLPIYYALNGHLYNSNFHINAQNYERIWNLLREQADFFITVLRNFDFLGCKFIKTIEYSNYIDAVNKVLPLKRRLFMSKEERIENSRRGDIRYRWICVPKRIITYDTRYFHKVVFGYPYKKDLGKEV